MSDSFGSGGATSPSHRVPFQANVLDAARSNDAYRRVLFTGARSQLVVTPGTRHNVVNAGKEPLRIYTTYVPPNHIDGRVHQTKADAEADKADEAFGRSVR